PVHEHGHHAAVVRAFGRAAVVHRPVDRLVGGHHSLGLVVDPEELVAAHALGAPALVGVAGLFHDEQGAVRPVRDVGHADGAVHPAHAAVRPRPPGRVPLRAAVFVVGPFAGRSAVVDDGIVLHGPRGVESGGLGGRALEDAGAAGAGEDVRIR